MSEEWKEIKVYCKKCKAYYTLRVNKDFEGKHEGMYCEICDTDNLTNKLTPKQHIRFFYLNMKRRILPKAKRRIITFLKSQKAETWLWLLAVILYFFVGYHIGQSRIMDDIYLMIAIIGLGG